MRKQKDVDGLLKALGHRKSQVRYEATKALGGIGGKRAVEPLIAALGDRRDRFEFVRHAAAEALGDIGDKRAVEPLIAALGDEGADVRKYAAEALGKIGDPRAVEPLIAALGVDGGRAAEALGRIGDDRAIQPLIAMLKSDSESVWGPGFKVAEALGKIGEARCGRPLEKALKSEKTAAAWAEKALGEESAGTLIAAAYKYEAEMKARRTAAAAELFAPLYDQVIRDQSRK